MKVAELKSPLLDYWVARADDWKSLKWSDGRLMTQDEWVKNFTVPIGWLTMGPIIERERISLIERRDHWFADAPGSSEVGPTPLISAMRAFIASRFGEEVLDELATKTEI